MKFSNHQLKLFEKAAEVANMSLFEKQHVGCVAVLKNKIIASSPNKLKTHPLQKEYNRFKEFNCLSDPQNMHSLHAEISCLSMIKHDINYKDLELYIVRVRKNKDYGLARPCVACMQLIRDLGIRRIYYSTNISFTFEELF